MPGHREYAVDRHAEKALPLARLGDKVAWAAAARIAADNSSRPAPVATLVRTIGAFGKESAGNKLTDVVFDQIQPFCLGKIALRHGDHARVEIQKTQNLKMLPGLLLDRIVCRNHQERQIDPGCAGKHVPHKSFVTGDIDYAEAKVSQRKFCKPQIDGDAPQFLFRQPICVHTGQGLNERSLAMIDVARRAQN